MFSNVLQMFSNVLQMFSNVLQMLSKCSPTSLMSTEALESLQENPDQTPKPPQSSSARSRRAVELFTKDEKKIAGVSFVDQIITVSLG